MGRDGGVNPVTARNTRTLNTPTHERARMETRAHEARRLTRDGAHRDGAHNAHGPADARPGPGPLWHRNRPPGCTAAAALHLSVERSGLGRASLLWRSVARARPDHRAGHQQLGTAERLCSWP